MLELGIFEALDRILIDDTNFGSITVLVIWLGRIGWALTNLTVVLERERLTVWPNSYLTRLAALIGAVREYAMLGRFSFPFTLAPTTSRPSHLALSFPAMRSERKRSALRARFVKAKCASVAVSNTSLEF